VIENAIIGMFALIGELVVMVLFVLLIATSSIDRKIGEILSFAVGSLIGYFVIYPTIIYVIVNI